ncbi:MAG: hypothetical protein ABW328_15990 [Ilumatobacteraceae bacterium]
MGQLVLLVVAAAWAAVLIPPLLRSRIENRPNSSVTDFRNQLSSLQRAMPSRGVAMRSMARPLAPSPLSRPAATGRPGLRPGSRTHAGSARTSGLGRHPAPYPPIRSGRAEGARLYDATPRARAHGGRGATGEVEAPSRERRAPGPVRTQRDAVKRRRANVLFVLALVGGCSLFLAATTRATAMLYVFGVSFAALCGYVYVLGQQRQREQFAATPEPIREPAPRRRAPAQGPVRVTMPRRPTTSERQSDRWSHAV